MCRAVIVDRIYEDAERIVPLASGLTVHEVVARLAQDHPDLFTAQDPGRPLPAFPDGLRWRLPTIAVAADAAGNPDYILQTTWHTRVLAEGETLAFVVVPRGGGGGSGAGKQVVGALALIALTIAAPYLVAGAAGAAGLGGFFGTAASLTMAGRLTAMGVVAGGAALMNALAPKTEGPATQEQRVYSAAAASNTLNPGGIVPVPYGLNRYAPPFATRPYVEYEGNEQLIYQVLCVGKGHQAIRRVLYGDTEVWNDDDGYTGTIQGLELEFCEPGEPVSLFPAGVVLASEVTGQELPNPVSTTPFEANWLGPFVVNGAGATNEVDRLAIDIYFPEGLYFTGPDGIGAFGADLMAQYRRIDDGGAPLGSWVTFVGDGTGENGGKRYWGATKEPQRVTEKVAVAKGRYEVRLAGTWPFQPADSDAKNRTLWAGLKGYLADFGTPPGVTQIAVKIQAGEDLNEIAANQFFVEFVRKLPIYDPETGIWSAPTETRSIAWAVADWLTNTDYGGGIADADIDLDWLAAYDQLWESRGDTFNAIMDREWMLLDGANAILRCGRSQVVRIGDRIGFTRYEAKDVKRAVFTPRSIVRGSFKRRWIFADDQSPDSKYCKFLDAATWQYDEVKAVAPGYGSTRPVEETMFGFVDRDHVWREGVTDVAINAFRDREFVSFTTEWDGKRLVRGDPVLVAHPLMANTFGMIAGVDGAVLSLDRDIAGTLLPQWVEDAADWTGVNEGAPGDVADVGGAFVSDTTFGRTVLSRSGTATNPIRSKRVIEAPRDDTIIELQVRWRVVGAGQGRIVARCIGLDDDWTQVGTIAGEATELASGPAEQTSRFFFATNATIDAGDLEGVLAWPDLAKHLRFGVNVNAGEGDAEVRIAQIRIRPVHGLTDRIYIRGKDGSEWGFCDVETIPDDRTIVLNAAHLASVEGADGAIASILPGERAGKAHLALFQDGARPFDGLVVSARPTGPHRVDVLCVRDAPEPYVADETSSPPPYLPPRKPPAPPDRPIVSGLSARLVNGDFDVQLVAGWLPAAGARFYVADVSYDGGDSWTRVYRGREARFTATAARQSQTVRVRAFGKLPGPWDQVTVGTMSVPTPKPPIDTTPPAPPTGLSAIGGLSQALVEWTNPGDDDLAHVVVLANTEDDEGTATIADSMIAPGQSLVVSELEDDTDYWFWAYAVDTSGNQSSVAGPVTAKTVKWPFGPPNTDPPGVPTSISLTPGFNLLVVDWTNPADDDLADIEVWANDADDLGTASLVTTARAPGASAIVGELPNDATRWVWLRAVDFWGNKSDFAAGGSATTLDNPFGDPNTVPPGDPVFVAFTPGFHLIEVAWTNPGDADLAEIEVWCWADGSPGAEQHIGSARAPGSTFVATGLDNDATYWFWIRAVDHWGNKSDLIACGSATTLAGTADIANNAIDSDMVQALAVLETKLAANAVSVGKIATSAVTVTKIADGSISTPKLVANAVTANELAAGAVIAGKLAVGAVTASEIAVGAVVAEKVAAGAILASKLVLTDTTNLVTNPILELPDGTFSDDYWSFTPSYASGSSLAAFPGNPSNFGGYFLGNASTKVANWGVYIPIVEGESYAVAVDAFRQAGANGNFYVQVFFYDKDKVYAGTFQNALATSGPAAWTTHRGMVTVPAGVSFMTIRTATDVSHTAGYWAWTRLIVRKAANAEIIVDGAVIADKIDTNAVIAGKVAAGAVIAGTIAANVVTVIEIAANAVTATQIAALTILAGNIAAAAIIASKVAANAIIAGKIAADAVIAGTIAANAVTVTEIAALTIVGGLIAASTIIGDKLVANTLTTRELAANSVTTNQLTAGSVTANSLAANAVTAAKIAVGAIVAGKISAGAINTPALFVDGVIITDLIAEKAVTAPDVIAAGANWSPSAPNNQYDNWYNIPGFQLTVELTNQTVYALFFLNLAGINSAAGGGAIGSTDFRLMRGGTIIKTWSAVGEGISGSAYDSDVQTFDQNPPDTNATYQLQIQWRQNGAGTTVIGATRLNAGSRMMCLAPRR